jgi:hypothetical protein
LLSFFLLVAGYAVGQDNAEIRVDKSTHDFGNIGEADGLATHVFSIKNTGTEALVITRVTASCGCAHPDWTKEPVAPGKTGEVTVSYNPKGRPGPFHKSIAVFSNAKNNRALLYVKGYVQPKPAVATQPSVIYPYSIGDLKLQTKSIIHNGVRPGEFVEEKILVRNEGEGLIEVSFGKMPPYIKAQIRPDTLAAGENGEITIVFDTDKAKRMGRIMCSLPLEVATEGVKKPVEGEITMATNVIDNFTRLSASEKAKAPVAQFSLTLLDFGKLPEKSGGIISFIGMGGKESESFTITNTGKSTLLIYSVTSENELVDVSGGKKELKPGATAEYKVSVKPKEIKAKLEAFITIVCNDPGGPVRLIKVMAEK